MSLFRLFATKVGTGVNVRNRPQCLQSLLKVCPLLQSQSATMIGVDRKDPEIDKNKPKPWPYKTKKHYIYWHYLLDLDNIVGRFDTNTKIIVVEGNKASGKEVVAQELAKQFGLLYMPETDLSELYINHNNFDYRSLNHYIDPLLQAVDEKMYYEDPYHRGVHYMKLYFYYQRFEQYIDALAHLYNTGQGVILERSPYSDFVFTEAMNKCGFFKDDARDYYYRVRHNSIYDLQRPHLVLYLDVPVDECLNRIKKRNIPHEVNSKVLTKEYLGEIENQYKNRFLPEASKGSQVMIYDWSEYGDIEDIVDDIEKLNLDDWDPHEERFEDWNLYEDDLFEINRNTYTNYKPSLCRNMYGMNNYDVDSLWMEQDIGIHRDKIYRNMIPNYGIYPYFDPANTTLLQRLLRWRLPYREAMEFGLRQPFY